MRKTPKIENLRDRHEALIDRMIDVFQLPRPFVWDNDENRVELRHMLYLFRDEDMPQNMGAILIDVLRHCEFTTAETEGVEWVLEFLDVYGYGLDDPGDIMFRNSKIEGFSFFTQEQSAIMLEWLNEIIILEGYGMYRQTLKSAIRYWEKRIRE